VNDSMLLTGVDIYAAALSIYHCLRRNADTTSLKDTVDELKKGFARPTRKKPQQEVEAAPAPVAPPSQQNAQIRPVSPAADAPNEPEGGPSAASKTGLPTALAVVPQAGASTTLVFSPHALSQTLRNALPSSCVPAR
jgi:hypothetical protein